MNDFLELVKVVILGILEGVTEWLPISSTGHLLLLDDAMPLRESDAFKEVFFVVIQLGAILAVPFFYGKKMLPLGKGKAECISLWAKVVLACLPGAILSLFLDEKIENFLNGTKGLMPLVIAAALIVYGVLFILIERKPRAYRVSSVDKLRCADALKIGLFQALSIIPGTSRSGSTVIGALFIGVERSVAAEFSFFLAVPVMAGYSMLKLIRFGFDFTPYQLRLLLVGALCAFLTSLFVIRFLISYVKKHSFAAFGFYRILLGLLILCSLLFRAG